MGIRERLDDTNAMISAVEKAMQSSNSQSLGVSLYSLKERRRSLQKQLSEARFAKRFSLFVVALLNPIVWTTLFILSSAWLVCSFWVSVDAVLVSFTAAAGSGAILLTRLSLRESFTAFSQAIDHLDA